MISVRPMVEIQQAIRQPAFTQIINVAVFCYRRFLYVSPGPDDFHRGSYRGVSGRWFATVAVCFSFALVEFSLKRFLSFFDCFMPAALSRFGTLAEFGTLGRGPNEKLR